MRRKEQALEKLPVDAERGSALAADPRRRQPKSRTLHQLSFTGDISACRRDTAAGILDQRTRDQIGTDLSGLQQVGKFSVAVVDHDMSIGIHFADCFTDTANIFDRQRAAVIVTAGALQHHAGDLRIGSRPADLLIIRFTGGSQIDLAVTDPVVAKRADTVAGNADRAAERVIGRAGNGQNGLPRIRERKHRAGQRVRSVDKL